MSKIDQTYHQLLNNILEVGYKYPDPNRTGVERLEIPNYTFRHEFKDGFPAITTKKLNYKNVVTELIWFLKGDTNIKYLIDNGCNIWNKDGYKFYEKWYETHPLGKDKMSFEQWLDKQRKGYSKYSGDLGAIYGYQWRNFNGIDQIRNLIQGLKEKPLGTEHIVSAWNPADKSKMALPPCHYGFQIVVRPLIRNEKNEIVKVNYSKLLNKDKSNIPEVLRELNKSIPQYGFELHWNQRSVDTFLGLPYNIVSYATLALILEKITGYKALGIQGDLKKVHLYNNSLDAVKEQLSRDVNTYDKCELSFHGEEGTSMFEHYYNEHRKDITLDVLFNNFKPSTFKLLNYDSYPHIKVEMLERDE